MKRVAGVYKFILSLNLIPSLLLGAPTSGGGTDLPADLDPIAEFDPSLLAPGEDGQKNPFIFFYPQLDLRDIRRVWGLYDLGTNTAQFNFTMSDEGSYDLYAESTMYVGELYSLLSRGFVFECSVQFQIQDGQIVTIAIPSDHVQINSANKTVTVRLYLKDLPENASDLMGLLILRAYTPLTGSGDDLFFQGDWNLGAMARASVTFPPITNVHNGGDAGNDFDSAVQWNQNTEGDGGVFGCGVITNKSTPRGLSSIFISVLMILSLAAFYRRSLKQGEF